MPVSVTSSPWARASQPTIVAISCTSCFVSLALVDCERSWLSFARRHGWLETWTFGGSWEAISSRCAYRYVLIVTDGRINCYILPPRYERGW